MYRSLSHKYCILQIALGLMLCSVIYACGRIDAEETLQAAEIELRRGNIENVANSCQVLTDSTATTLTPTQMCRVAIMYAKLSDISENTDYMVSAAECFDRAFLMSDGQDTLTHYIENLSLEDQSYVRVISEIARGMNTPIDYQLNADEESDTDSLPGNDPSNYPQQPDKMPATAA